MGLEYIHSKNIIHRDIKPENLVLDENGYVRITDFGIAKLFSNNNAKETSGTPGYMAPEVMKGQNHSFTVDFFALGIMGYEFMLGKRPYSGRSRREIKEQMMSKNAQISLSEIPNGWSEEAADFFNKLLQRKPEIRLGHKGIFELKQHRWMKFFPTDKLFIKELESPFIPEKKDNFDKKYCEANDSINIETKVRYEKYRNDIEYDNYFINFTYYGIISEYEEETKQINSLSNSINKNNNDITNIKKYESKENEQDICNIIGSSEESNTNKSNSNKFIYDIKKEDIEIKKQNNNILKNTNINFKQEKMLNVPTKKPIKNFSFTIKFDNYNNENIKRDKKNSNSNYLKNVENQKQSMLLRNTSTIDDYSGSTTNRNNKKNNKNSRSKTPTYIEKRQFILESNNKNFNKYNNRIQNKSVRNNLNNKSINQSLLANQNKYNNYKENIRNLFSKKARKNMNICSPGYYSKHSLQINNNSNKYHNLLLKRNSKSDFNKLPTGSISSIDISKNMKSPKITTSTSTSLQGYKKRTKSVTPINKNNKYLRPNNSANNIHKNLIKERSKNSRVNLSNIYNQNFSYAKRIKEMNSFNYNNRMMGNGMNIKNIKNSNEIISSYSISSSNILKQIRNTNYNKNKVNIINKNNPLFLYNNINNNQRMKQNNKISLELELNADSQTFTKNNKINNNKKENNSKNKNSNSNQTIKNNILNKNHSTINISSMKMGMNGNININVVIKGNNNTTNLINKIEVKKKNGENNLKNISLNNNNNKKFQKSHSIGFFNLKL